MTKPSRRSRGPAFSADEKTVVQGQDDLGDVLDMLPPKKVESARLQSVPPLPVVDSVDNAAPQRAAAEALGLVDVRAEVVGEEPAPVSVADSGEDVPTAEALVVPGRASEAVADAVAATDSGDRRDPKSGRATAPAKQTGEVRKKPPAVWVANEVYSRLLEYSDQEKRTLRSAARPFGAIAMDAIERHAAQLATSWKESAADSGRPGTLFVRETRSGNRRHERPPRAVTLQGVGPENAKLLKRLKKQWGAGSVSDLVERALRLEFGMSGGQP